MKKLTSILLAVIMILSYAPSGIFEIVAGAESEVLSIKPTEDTWAGYSTSYRNVIQGVEMEEEEYNIHDRLYSIGSSSNGDLSTKVYNSAMVYMKYDLAQCSDVKITSAKLKLYGRCLTNNAVNNMKMFFFKVDNKWAENALIYGSTPINPIKNETPQIDLIGLNDPNRIQPDFVSEPFNMSKNESGFELKEFDVTDLLKQYDLTKDSTVSFAYIVYPTAYVFEAVSKDAPESDMHPVLEITTEPIPDMEAISGPSGEVEYDSSVSVKFSNNIDASSVSPSALSLFKDGEEVEVEDGDIMVENDELTISTAFSGYCDYELVLSTDIKDIYGNSLTQETRFPFFTIGVHTENTYEHTEGLSGAEADILDAALLLKTNPDATRSTATGKTQIMGGGTNHHVYYVEIDLSTIDTSVPFASFIYKLKFSMSKSGQVFNVIEINDDFDTSAVTYNEIIDAVNSGSVVSQHSIGIRNNEYYDFDITNYVNGKLSSLSDDDKVIRFAIRSTVNSTTTNFYSNFASSLNNRPKAVIVFDDDSFTGIKSTEPSHGSVGVAVDSSLNMTFSVPMEDVNYENFSLTNLSDMSSVELSDGDVVYDASTKTATITPPVELDELTTYELSAFGAYSLEDKLMHTKKIKFITGSRLSINSMSVSGADDIDEDSMISASAVLENATSGTAKGCELILALFNGDRVVKIVSDSVDSIAASSSKTLEVSLLVGEDSNGYDNYMAKAFLWDSTDSMYPLCEHVVGGNDASGVREGKFFGIHTLNGNLPNSSEAQITLVVRNSDGEICWLNQTTAGEGGEYDFNVDLPESGNYTACIMSEGTFGEKTEIAVDDYVSYDDYLSVWDDINSENISRIEAVLIKAIRIFDFDEINYSIDHITDNIASDIKENGDFGRYTDDNIAEFYDFLRESAYEHYSVAEILAQIDDAVNHSVMTDILDNDENARYLGIESYLSDYRKNKTKINKALVGKTFDDVESFVKAFKKALKEAKDENDDDKPSGGSSISNSGSSSGSIYMGGVMSESQTSDGSMSSSSESASKIVQNEENYFLDLGSALWAEKEIEFLYRMGIVNGREERKYFPSDNVLREEFVKLIVEAVELDTSSAVSDFEDVSMTTWCYPYVSTAYANRIINGITASKFGAGTPITRQDICVITARTLELAGFSAKPENEAVFSDSARIAAYAKDAVGYLSEIGIITGTTDGKFNPENYATRAETACIIYRTLDYMKTNGSSLWKAPTLGGDESESSGDYVFNTPTPEQIQNDIENVLMKKSHPYIHATRDTFESIKQSLAAGDDDYIAKEYAQTKEKADGYLKTKVVVRPTVSQAFSNIQPLVVSCMTVYFVEGGEQYLNRCLQEFENFKNVQEWYSSSQLNTTMTMMSIAICYDWLYDYLTEEQRAWAVNAIVEHGLEMSYKVYQTPSALKSIRAEYKNINIVCGYNSFNHAVFNNSHNIIAALAIAQEKPEYSAFIISNALYGLECYLELVKDGGFEEPSTYYGYCTGRYVYAVSALKSSLDTLYGYEKSPGFRNTAWWGLYMFGPMVFGDCVPDKSPYDTDTLYILAKESKNEAMMKRIVDLDYSSSVWTLLWYEKGSHDKLEDYPVPLDRSFSVPDQQIVVMRDHTDDNYNIFTGIYAANGNATGHSDPVSGLFCLDAYGERFATALGYGDYDLDGYWDNHQTGRRWNYYERRTEAGNCLIINPSLDVGQDVTATATITDYQTSNGAVYAIADLQPVYHREVKSYKRGLKMHNNRSQIVVQDEAVMKKPSEIFWSFNTPAQIEIIDQTTAILSHGDKKVAVKVYANVPYELYVMPAEKLPTSPVVETQREWKEFRKLAIKAKGVEELKLMVEFTPFVSELQMPESVSGWVDLESWTATEIGFEVPKLKSISFNGTPIEGFDPENYFYEVDAGEITKQPQITAEAQDGYLYEVIYPEKLPGAVDIAVGDEEGEFVNYYRVRVMGASEKIDVSKYNKLNIKKVTTPQHDGNVAENVIDGLLSTRWSASSEKGETYLDMDLGSEHDLKAINIAFHSGDSRNTYFEIHTSVDGRQWTKALEFGRSSGKTADFEAFALESSGVRYVRFVGQDNSANHWNSVSEIEIYGD